MGDNETRAEEVSKCKRDRRDVVDPSFRAGNPVSLHFGRYLRRSIVRPLYDKKKFPLLLILGPLILGGRKY